MADNKQHHAIYYEELDNRRVRCHLCPHHCNIPSGHTGICGVRHNHDGVLVAESYGQITALALDPIEKKPLARFHPGSLILSAGSYGCNLKCSFCQNHTISQSQMQFLPEPYHLHEQKTGCKAGSFPDWQVKIGLHFTGRSGGKSY